MPNTYQEFTEQDASRKILLCKLNAAKRLVGWTVYLGSVYKIEIEDTVFAGIFEAGVAYTSVDSAVLMPQQYFYDRRNGVLYLRTIGSLNPNSVFIHAEITFFFSDRPVALPNDLDTGFVVDWLPFIKRSSGFQFAIDNKETQVGSPIESKSSLSMINDGEFWIDKYEQLIFENKAVRLYSYNLNLPVQQAKLVFKGTIQSKSYSVTDVSFQLKDPLNELRSPLPQDDYRDYEYTHQTFGTIDARMSESNITRRQRSHYGRPNGVRLTNIDEDLETGNFVRGTFSVTGNSSVVGVVSGTFIGQDLLQGDEIEFSTQPNVTYEIKSIQGSGAATFDLTEVFTGATNGSVTIKTKPSNKDGRFDRHYHICGHNFSIPQTTVTGVFTAAFIAVADATFLQVDDKIQVGSEFTNVLEILGTNFVKLTSSLSALPPNGTIVKRLPIRHLYVGSRDVGSAGWTYNTSSKHISLSRFTSSPEFALATPKALQGTYTTNGTSQITGTGTDFSSQVEPGDFITINNSGSYDRVLAVDDATTIWISGTAAALTVTAPRVIHPEWATEENISADLIGKPFDDVQLNTELQRGPDIVRDLLSLSGLVDSINDDTFDDASIRSPHVLGLSIPKDINDDSGQVLREIINSINKSILGVMYQDDLFQMNYAILQPTRESVTSFFKNDALSFSIESDASDIIKSVRLKYDIRDLDYRSSEGSSQLETFDSPYGIYLVGSTKVLELATLLTDVDSARIFASRWAFIMSFARSLITLQMKLRGQLLNINDRVEFSHPRMYKQAGSGVQTKVGLISNIRRGANNVEFEYDDLSSAFSRCAVISENDAENFLDASDEVRFENGYITDPDGLIDNDPDTIGINLIW